MEHIIASILIVFAWAAYQDYKKREITDILTMVAWFLSTLFFDMRLFVIFFIAGWFVAEVAERMRMRLAAFGDVLWFPVFASLLAYFNADVLLASLFSLLASQVYLWYASEKREKGVPFVLVLLISLALAVTAKAFFY